MPKWKRQNETVCMHGTVKCANAEDDAEAQYIVTTHNAEIDALLAERDRLAAENAELKRRLDAVVKSLEPDHEDWRGAAEVSGYHARAVAIAEGRDNG